MVAHLSPPLQLVLLESLLGLLTVVGNIVTSIQKHPTEAGLVSSGGGIESGVPDGTQAETVTCI